ncbi:MAG TPA: hypothetical protein VGP64_04170 [Polyangia bacterium]
MRPGPIIPALCLALLECQKAAVECPAMPTVVCPEAGVPSFSDVYANVISPLCDRCHIAGGQEASMPLTNYQQIYGKNGTEAGEIRNQVQSCQMPPPGGPEVLTDDERQLLLGWIACGAPDNPIVDAGAGD